MAALLGTLPTDDLLDSRCLAQTLEAAGTSVRGELRNFASAPDFSAKMQLSFGSGFERLAAAQTRHIASLQGRVLGEDLYMAIIPQA